MAVFNTVAANMQYEKLMRLFFTNIGIISLFCYLEPELSLSAGCQQNSLAEKAVIAVWIWLSITRERAINRFLAIFNWLNEIPTARQFS